MVQEQGGVLSGQNPTAYNVANPVTLFIIQCILIIFFTRILHLVLSRFRQPRVISEIIGGIILGPSVLGRIPGYTQTFFPEASRANLNLLSTLGLVLYLFIVGVELNPKVLVQRARIALTISAAGIALPFALGIGVGYGLYTQMGDTKVPFSSFILFIGVAMSITAFPVLARILSELQLLRTYAGATALTAGVGDDVAAWVLLALVVTIINASSSIVALYVFLLTIAWLLVVIFVIRPILLKLIVKTGSNDNGPTVSMMVITLSLVLISAFVTDIVGVHPIFGGFIVGVIIPHESGFAVRIIEKIEDLVSVLFLPIYFALSGIRTQIGLLNDGKAWGWVFLVIFVAMTGKITGATLAARLNKMTWRESLTIGVFMSCKGLVELIVLNIGLDAKVINEKIFVIMIVMALVTTIVTTPLATYLYPHEYQRKMELLRNGHLGPEATQDSDKSISKKNRLLIVLNKVEYLPPMMMIVRLLQPTAATAKQQDEKNDSSITVHVLRLIELTQRISTVMKINENEETLHDPIMNIFRTFGQMNFVKVKANLAVVAQQDFAQHVFERAEDTNANLVIIPWDGAGAIIEDPSNPFVGPKEKKETSPQVAHFTQQVFTEATARANVGVFVDRGLGVSSLNPIEHDISIHVFLPFFGGNDDREALSFVVQLLDHSNASVTILRIKKSLEPTEHDAILERSSTPHITIETGERDDGSGEVQRPALVHRVSAVSAYILDSKDERDASEIKDKELLTQVLKSHTEASKPRINFSEISTSTPLQTAVKRAKDIVGRKDLIVVGRGRHEATFDHKVEISDMLKTLGDYSIDTHKSLGDVAQAFLAGNITASILVLQAKKTAKLKEIVEVV